MANEKAKPAAALIALALACPAVQAHLLQVFAAAEGNRIEGSVYFAGGARAHGADIVVSAPNGRVLAELQSDGDGTFAFTTAEQVDHLIVAETPEGHRGTWTVRAGELAGEMPTPVGIAVRPPREGAAGDATKPRDAAPGASLEGLVEAAVARQIKPLREQILAYESRLRLRDLLGGIGYIVGVAGALLWWRARREGRGV